MNAMNQNLFLLSGSKSWTRQQIGFTLIELMIGITLGLLILLALISLYVNTSRTNTEMAKSNSLIDSGRFAVQLLESDIVHAGFWGTYIPQFDDFTFDSAVPGDVPDAIPDPCLVYNATNWIDGYKRNLIGIPVQVYDTVPICTGVIANKLTNTDILVVRHAETCVPGVGNCESDISGKLYFQASLCEAEINPAPPTAPKRYVIDTNTTNFTLKKRDCTGTLPTTIGTLADKRKFISNIYYIRDYAVTSGDGIPTLVRSKFDLYGGTLAHQAAESLIEGIQALRVELGIDTLSKSGAAVSYANTIVWLDASGNPSTTSKVTPSNRGDGKPDTFIRCTTASPCTPAQLANVVTVKLYVLARSQEASPGYTDTKTYCLGTANADGSCPAANQVGPFNDRYKRHLFSSTVRLNNIASRRETP